MTSAAQVLVAWGPQAVVISFRGTSSVKGAKMDICVRAPTWLCILSETAVMHYAHVWN